MAYGFWEIGLAVESASLVRTGELYRPKEWNEGGVDWEFSRSNPVKFDEDRNYEYWLTKRPKSYTSWAVNKNDGSVHGAMTWGDNRNGVIVGISTHPDHRRTGVATNLLLKTRAHAFDSGITSPIHASSVERTYDGDRWVEGIGEDEG